MKIKNIINTFVITLSFILFAQSGQAKQRFVNSISDFKTHTSVHIRNVNRLGMHLYYQYRYTYFKDIPERILREKLLLHDFEKLASAQDLEYFGYKNDETFLDRLYFHYGKNKSNTPTIQPLIQDLVEFVEVADEAFFKKYDYINSDGTLTETGQKIALIEKIADLVEREKNPVSPEEFGVKEMREASAFFQDSWEKEMAQQLAKIYPEIVKPNPLIYIAKSENFHIYRCAGLFNG